MLWCFIRLVCWLNSFLHTSHILGFSMLCMCWCVNRLLFRLNSFLHTSQIQGHSPIYMGWWILKHSVDSMTYYTLHTCTVAHHYASVDVLSDCSVDWMPSHLYRHSPLCIRLCVLRWICRLNVLLHTSHEYGRSPVCMRWWRIRLDFWLNSFLHISQV